MSSKINPFTKSNKMKKIQNMLSNFLVGRKKKKAKKKLHNLFSWEIKNPLLEKLLTDYFNLHITSSQDIETYLFDFKFSIVRYRSQMGHLSPCYDAGSPNCINNLTGDEKYFFIELFDYGKGFQKYDNKNYQKFGRHFICAILLNKEDFEITRYQDPYAIRICIGKIRIIIEFHHLNERTGSGDIYFAN